MTGLCDLCAYRQADCKGNKDLEKTRCDYYKKPQVFNAKEAAERIAELEMQVERWMRVAFSYQEELISLREGRK